MNKYELDKILDMDERGEWVIYMLKKLKNGDIQKKEIAVFKDEYEAREVFTDLANTFYEQ